MSQRPSSVDDLVRAARAHDHPSTQVTERAWARLQEAASAGAGPSVATGRSSAAGSSGTASSTTSLTLITGVTALGVVALLGLRAALPGPSPDRPQVSDDGLGPSSERAARPVPSAEQLPPKPSSFVESPQTDTDLAEPRPRSAADTTSKARPRPQEKSRSTALPRSKAASSPAAAALGSMDEAEAASPSDSASDLAAQAQLLGRAWSALSRGEPDAALAHVREHQRRFPATRLARERRACTLVAECQRDDPDARARAASFLASGLTDTFAQRVEAACRSKSTSP